MPNSLYHLAVNFRSVYNLCRALCDIIMDTSNKEVFFHHYDNNFRCGSIMNEIHIHVWFVHVTL